MEVESNVTSDGRPITIGDDSRWKKHFKSSKKRCYNMSLDSRLFRANFDLIRWDDLGRVVNDAN